MNYFKLFSTRKYKTTVYFLSYKAQLAGVVEYTDCVSADTCNECPVYDIKKSDGEAAHPFIAIAPRSTVIWSGIN